MKLGNLFIVLAAAMIGVSILDYMLKPAKLKKARREADSIIQDQVYKNPRQINRVIKIITRIGKSPRSELAEEDRIRIGKLEEIRDGTTF